MPEDKKQTTSISVDDLQKLLETMLKAQGDQHLKAIEALKEPYRSPKDIENERLAKERFAANEAQDRMYKKRKQDACKHTRPEDSKSLFFKIRNVFPRGAFSLVCCRCFKMVQNYNPETGKLIHNEEFERWVNIPPTIIVQR